MPQRLRDIRYNHLTKLRLPDCGWDEPSPSPNLPARREHIEYGDFQTLDRYLHPDEAGYRSAITVTENENVLFISSGSVL